MFGHKVAGMIDMVAVVLPGAHDDCNGPIANGQLIETTIDANGNLVVDTTTIAADKGTSARLTVNLWGNATAGELLAPDTAAPACDLNAGPTAVGLERRQGRPARSVR